MSGYYSMTSPRFRWRVRQARARARRLRLRLPQLLWLVWTRRFSEIRFD